MRRLLVLIGLLLFWEVLAGLGWVNPLYAPPPHQVVLTLLELFQTGEILPHLQATFTAALLGLGGGILLGGVLGLMAAFSPFFSDLLEPLMLLLNAIPRVILAPLFVIWLGIGLASKVALSLILVAVLIFFAVYSGVKQVDPRLLERVRTLVGEGVGCCGRSTCPPFRPGSCLP
ncbi:MULTISPECIES: ABC transporter permease [Thermus]|uniref:ABC transporter permease n=1 Tax=Thermus brockianus TaxID=56956 RepID=UPI001F36E240|nr:ABC transporter permease subunit [Thermus brockianus]